MASPGDVPVDGTIIGLMVIGYVLRGFCLVVDGIYSWIVNWFEDRRDYCWVNKETGERVSLPDDNWLSNEWFRLHQRVRSYS